MQRTVSPNDWVGRVVDGRFPLLESRGGSGASWVFLTEWEGPGGPRAAIKFVPGDREAVEKRLARWASAAELSHPRLMRVFHAGRTSIDGVELAYAVTECADEVLGEIIEERPLAPDEARAVLEPILDTLAYLHGQGFVHGHLKPSNIVAVNDRLKLAGDDLYRAGHTNHGAVEEGVYAAPETVSGTISPAADLWLLGVTLVEVLTQHPPAFDPRAGGEPVVPDSVPEPFAAMARACLRRAPAQRATLEQVRAMVEGKTAAVSGPERPSAPAEIQPAGAETAVGEAAEIEAAKVEPPRFEAAKIGRAWGEDEREPDDGWGMESSRRAKTRALALVAVIVAVAAAILLFAALSRKAHQRAASGAGASGNEGQASETQAPSTAQQPTSQPAASSAGGGQQVGEGGSPAGVTAKGAVADRVMPDVAASAIRTIHGKVQVEVRVEVGPDGGVANADFISPGVSRYFASRAMEAARRWRFSPARAGRQAVRSVWTVRFVFRQSGTEASAKETSP